MSNINIFVYGSLREGFFNYNKYLDGKVIEVKPARLKGMHLYHMPYKGYPAILPGNGEIIGEIVSVKDYDNTIKAIDDMEGFINTDNPKNEYNKILLEVEDLNTKNKENCYVYFYNKHIDSIFDEKAVHIPHGNWKNYMLNNK
ncbi:gamma-glutamylcyclotransferase [Clostridium botulinum]|uniref:gamma-glutamylcyclotransferase family protein n=1 Tax=Clostridium cagae TaxID=2080751 RepID=UPI000502576F|nr:hypothetical protein KU41_00140 [Clostridium botulinum]MBY6803191.1 gamma-glutamylcyclotransferase [Clostridium botulinum]MBY6813736.1 gamma-glutamylcyclotransferase [Clostridium botulinum]MBY6820323.1 gamma-glutamylcyclotransferase [Clostridium botulinum]NFI95851.1 gamma-glutamylcyclotransferase [Clostridium botulinum]